MTTNPEPPDPEPPDLAQGVPLDSVPADGVLGVRLDGEPWLLARVKGEVVLLSAKCTHYGGPLAKGLREGDAVRCPWHHACFDLKSGRALEAPAFQPLKRRAVRIEGDRVFAAGEAEPAPPAQVAAAEGAAKRIVVVGAGAAGFAAVDRLRALGHAGPLAWFDADAAAPYDRPKLSKPYLAGKAKRAELALTSDHTAGLAPRRERVVSIHLDGRQVELEGGERISYDTLLLAPGGAPKRPDTPGFDRPEVRLLRSVADADALIAAAETAQRVAIVGAGFIGLEVAASLRTRGKDVVVVTPEQTPLAGKLGPELGGLIQRLHEAKGVGFRLGRKAVGWSGTALTLDDGASIAADLLVVGVGVAPRLELAESAGLARDGAVPVDAGLRVLGADAVWAAGDAARFPDSETGAPIRVEHWVAAERMGQIAAESMLDLPARWAEPPFFWSAHYDVSIRYVGHAERWDWIEIDGDLEHQDAELRYIKAGRTLAVATVNRDLAALRAAETLRRAARTAAPG